MSTEREDFEEYEPMPSGVFWSDEMQCYTTKSIQWIDSSDRVNELFDCWKARARATNRIEKDLIIELAVLEGKYAAVCDELESLSKKQLPAGHQC